MYPADGDVVGQEARAVDVKVNAVRRREHLIRVLELLVWQPGTLRDITMTSYNADNISDEHLPAFCASCAQKVLIKYRYKY